MINKRVITLIGTIVLSIVLVSCSSNSILEKVYPTLNDGLYDSEFPYRNSSVQLEEISKSINLINSIAFYTSYVFDSSSKIRAVELSKINFEKNAAEKVFFNRTASGTGTIIYNRQGHVALLTVSHIVNFPDSVISFFVNSDGSFSEYVQSISIKSKQTNYVNDIPGNGELDILAIDKIHDIALLGKTLDIASTLNIPVFPYIWGASSELEWGSFIYAFGFPMNLKMITKGIVSSPNKEKYSFLIDAAFNRGFSGRILNW
jgi:S1-C subfamily serine protease